MRFKLLLPILQTAAMLLLLSASSISRERINNPLSPNAIEWAEGINLPASAANTIFAARHLQVLGEVVRLGPPVSGDSRRGVAVRFLHTPRFATALE